MKEKKEKKEKKEEKKTLSKSINKYFSDLSSFPLLSFLAAAFLVY